MLKDKFKKNGKITQTDLWFGWIIIKYGRVEK